MPIPPTRGVQPDAPLTLEATRCLLCDADDGMPLVESAAQMSSRHERFTFVRCRACGLIYLNPRIPEADIGDWYAADYLPHRGDAAWGRYAPFAALGQRGTDRARVRTVMRSTQLGPATRALDVGCGRPTFLEALHRRTGVRGTGIDFSDAGWRDEPERWRAAELDLRHGRLEATALSGGFDLITLWHALEHDYRPRATLERLRTLARDGATLVVEVPDYDGLTRRLQGSAWAGYHTPRHTASYTATTLRAMLEGAGWRVVRQARSGTLDPYVLWWLGQEERAAHGFDGSLESRFPGFMAGKLATLPLALVGRWVRLGIQLAVATAG